jgi:hypothetical protein
MSYFLKTSEGANVFIEWCMYSMSLLGKAGKEDNVSFLSRLNLDTSAFAEFWVCTVISDLTFYCVFFIS